MGRRERGGLQLVNEVWRVQGWVQYRVKLQMASIRQDKPAYMLRLGLDFTPLLMSTAFHKCKERMRDEGPEQYGEVVKQLLCSKPILRLQ